MYHVNRLELKYQLNHQEAKLLKTRLTPFMQRDPYNQNGPYFIRSVYFDNPCDRSFIEKIEGFERRRKYRLRFYDFTLNLVKFEIKKKDNDMVIKHTAIIQSADIQNIFQRNYDCLLKYHNSILSQVYYDFKCDFFEPIVVVDYYRDAFFLDYNHIRVTFDYFLRKSDAVTDFHREDLLTIPVLEDYCVILEIKYEDFVPNWFRNLFLSGRYQRCATSKYCLSRMIRGE